MIDRAAARRWAEAFVGTVENARRLEEGLEELKAVAKAYEENRDLRRFLGSPELGEEEKRSLLSRLFSGAAGPEPLGLVELLLKWDRADHLPAIAEEAVKAAQERRGILRGVVATAHPISSAETEALAGAVGRRLGKRVILERRLEPQMIGGVRVWVGSTLLDGSVSGALQRIRRQLLEAKVA